MSITITCDYCGEVIESRDSQRVTLQAKGDKGGPKRERWRDGYHAHYHGEPCYPRVFEAIRAIHQDELERIPTATSEEIAEFKPGDEGEHELDFEQLFETEMRQLTNGEVVECHSLRPVLAELGLYFPNEYHVIAQDITTLGKLRRAIEDGSLLDVWMIGPKRYDEIQRAVERIYAEGLAVA